MYSISEVNGIKIYNMSAGKTTPQFLQESKRTHKSLKYNEDFRKRIQLVQDLQFNVACQQVELTNDSRYMVAIGTYAPQIKIFDTAELSLKCLRGLDSEAIKFVMLDDDYSKFAIAETDRNIEFHTQFGTHFKIRVPHYPRDIVYNPFNCNLMVSASANEVYRINLEEGKFLQPFETSSPINSIEYNKYLNVVFFGGESFQVWDFRTRTKATTIKTDKEIFSVKSDSSGLLVAVGQTGYVDLFDVRFDRRLNRVRHAYMEPINCINFNPSTKHILSSTCKQLRITDYQGTLFTTVEPESNINMFQYIQNSGLILVAHQAPKVGCYFIPEMGPAPKWVPYLENVTEELQQTHKTLVYDQYKFLTQQEIFALECTNLIGTKMLKSHLHGYLMHVKLYNKLIASKQEVFDLDRYKQQKQEAEEKQKHKLVQSKSEQPSTLDTRFVTANNPDFAVDKFSEEYIHKHPNLKKQILAEKQERDRKLFGQSRRKERRH